jgi:hypothetical protein
MPDEQKQDKKEAPDFDAIVEKLNKSLDEKMSGIDQKLDAITPKEKEPKEEDIFRFQSDEEPEEETAVTKKDLAAFGETIAKKVLGEAKKIADRTYEEKATKQSRDWEAGRDFPLMNNGSKDFNQEFVKDVFNEVQRRHQSGRSKEDRDLVYDSAAAIYAKWINGGKYIPRKSAERDAQDANNRDDHFEFSGRRSNPSKGPNERQMNIGAQLGLSAEQVKQAIEKQGKKR